MKKIYLILLLSTIYQFASAQMSRVGNDSLIIHFPIGIDPSRLTMMEGLRLHYRVDIIDALPRLQMQVWKFQNEADRNAFLTIWGTYVAALEKSVLQVSEPKKARPRISEDTITIASANYWSQTFLRRCPQAGNTVVKVAVIDVGIFTSTGNTPQNALLNRYFDRDSSRNFTQETDANSPVQDKSPFLHGTRVAGVIANIYDSLGMNSAFQKLTIFKAFNQNGEANLWHILKAIDACIAQKIQIVNLSFNYTANWPPRIGATQPKLLLETAINIAKNYNILFVTAAGNEGSNVDNAQTVGFFPTQFQCDNLIKVAADSIGTQLMSFTNYGFNSVDIAAPGTVVVAGRNDTLMVSSGTSFAAPIVTALAAVEASKLTSFDWWAVKQALRARFKPTVPTAWQGKLKSTGGVLKPVCD
jgi:hypothetical protein